MKTTIFAIALAAAVASAPATAGSLTEPVVEPDVVEEAAVESSSDVHGLLAWVATAAILLGAAGAF